MTDYFRIPASWTLPEFVWRQSLDDMAIDGAKGCEGVALWFGAIEGETAAIRQCILLRGPGVLKRPNQLAIDAALMNKVTMAAIERGLILVGQIHSHGPFATTDLSYPDRYLGITEPGYLSLVAPDFALRPDTGLSDCGIHLHEGESGWRRLSTGEILCLRS
jgi:proteasome lid subunit RPN8/RPN11